MPELTGVGVSPGTGVGPVRRLADTVPVPAPDDRHGGDADAERAGALAALHAVAADLEARGAKAGGDAQDVLNAQALMAHDPELAAGVAERIGSGTSAARAVYEAFSGYREMLAGAGGYLAARVTDLDNVRDRVVAHLLDLPLPGVPESDEPYVLVARDLAPADTASLDPATVVAFVTEEGGPTSHTAILARAIGVPAVVACPDAGQLVDGTAVLVDGGRGTVLTDPPTDQVTRLRQVSRARARATYAATGPGATADGHPVRLYANIGGPQDLAVAVRNGAEGVGLFRTEFLFLGRDVPPSESEQEAAYRQVLDAFPGGTVVVRVLDAGADKPLDFLPPPGAEPNPALGERGLRMLRRHPDVLRSQLRALASAAEPDSVADSEGEPDSESVADSEGEPDSESVADSEGEPDSESVADSEGEPDSESVADSESAPDSESVADSESAPDSESEPGAQSPARLRVMAPMVADVEDADAFVAACGAAGVDSAGIMIEVPAAALRADDLARKVDFFSIGTNDLAQYTFAADRQVGALARLHDPWQPALLELISLTAAAAIAADIPCGVCGEAAADPVLACVFAGLGLTSLSMAAPALPLVRAALARHTMAQCHDAAAAALRGDSAVSARAAARTRLTFLPELGL